MKEILNNRYRPGHEVKVSLLYTVYDGYDEQNNRAVNLCILHQQTSQMKLEDKIRFKTSMHKLMAFEHPHIARIVDTQQDENVMYFVTEHSNYSSLKNHYSDININDVVGIIEQAAQALNYAHQKEMYHHNLTLGDFVIHNNTIQLHNFGLSFLLDYTAISDHALLLDIFSYTSPEQVGILRTIPDEKSDLYSLGIIFYQLLAGQLPFQAEKTEELLHQHISKTPQRPRKIKAEIPEVIDEIVMKLLNKEPQQRYQSAQGLLNDLERYKKGDLQFTPGKEDFSGKVTYRTRLIGREQELTALKTSFTKARAGDGKTIFIAGEAGRGKSRLIEEFSTFLLEEGVLFLEGKCFLRENKIPYQVFSELLNNYAEKIKNIGEEKRTPHLLKVKDIVGDLGEIILRINPAMKSLLGEQKPLVALDPEREHRRFIMTVSNFFLQLSAAGIPLVLFFDDLQWADAGTLSVLEQMISQVKMFPLVIIGGYRNNEVTAESPLVKIKTEAADKGYPLEELQLRPLNAALLNSFIAQLLLADENVMVPLTNYIWERSQGNPFFSIEILRQFIDQKGLTYEPDKRSWNIGWDKIHSITIPTNIVDIVLKRVENLDSDQRRLLTYASCIGKEFKVDFLFRLTDLPHEKVIEIVDQALTLRLLEAGPERGTFLFVHERIKAAFSQMLTVEQNKAIHLVIAKLITELSAGNLDAFLFDLAHHYTEAGEKDKCLEYALPAAEKAKQNYANEEAINYYNVVGAVLEERKLTGSREWMRVKEGLIEVYGTIGNHEEAIKLSREVLPLKQTPLEKAKIYRQMGASYFKKGSWAECEEANAQGLSLLGEKIPRGKAGILFSVLLELVTHVFHCLFPGFFLNKRKKAIDEKYSDIAWLNLRLVWMYILTDVGKLFRQILRFLNLIESKMGKSVELAVACYSYGGLCMAIPLFARGEKYFKEGMEIGESLNAPWIVAQMYQGLGFCYEWKGDCQKSLASFMTSRDKFQKLGDVWELGMCLDGIAHNYFYWGDYQNAIKFYSEYLDISERTNNYYGIAWGNIRLAYVNINMGELAKAKELLDKGVPLAFEKKIWFPYCVGNIIYGYLEKEKEDFAAAARYFDLAKKKDKENTFIRNYVVYLYTHYAETLISKYHARRSFMSKKERASALSSIRKACFVALIQTWPWANHRGGALRVYAQYLALAGKNSKANTYFKKAVEYARARGRKFEQAVSLYEYGHLLTQYPDGEEVRKTWQEAYKIFKETGAKLYLEKTAKQLGLTDEGESKARDRFAQERRLRTLIEVSHSLSSILDIDTLLETIVDSSMQISGAERGFLFTYTSEKKLEVRVAKYGQEKHLIEPELNYRLYKLSPTIIREVTGTGKSLLVNPTSSSHILEDEEIRAHRIKSIIMTPLKARNEILGYLYLDNRLVSEAFSNEDLSLIDSLGIQATISLQNAFYVQEMVEKQRLKEEILLGRNIQQSLLPAAAPVVKGLNIVSFMEPALEIGGDYYDFINRPFNDEFALVIGDVSGKGVPAGIVMSMLKMAITTLSQQMFSPKEILASTNASLHQQVKGGKFVSLLYFLWQPQEQKIVYSSAGHEHILVYRAQEKRVEEILSGGLVLGIVDNITDYLHDTCFPLSVGDKVLLYTDGVTDALNDQGNRLGLKKLRELFETHAQDPLDQMVQSIRNEVFGFMGEVPQYDDITLIAFERV